MNSKPSRREFLKESTAAAALLTGGYSATAAGFPKNETINVGLIGCGGRMTYRLVPALKKLPGVKVTAVCDVYRTNLEKGKSVADQGAFVTGDHHALLARKDVDAVIIATPDHWHVPITIDACAAGKDVYVEKPLTHKLSEGKAVIDAQNRHRRIVQVGTQQRSMPQFVKARELVEAGALGPIHKIHMCWNRNHTPYHHRVPKINADEVDWNRFLGNAPKQPFDPYRFHRSWRWFWDFGGGILTDLMVHWMDSLHFIKDIGLPNQVTTIGDHFTTEGVWETPDTIQTLMRFERENLQLHFEGTFASTHNRAGLTLMGEAATLYLDRGRLELTPQPRGKVKPQSMILGDGARGADFSEVDGEILHLGDWLNAIRTRKKPSAPAEAGVAAAAVAHLGNQAYREGRVLKLPA